MGDLISRQAAIDAIKGLIDSMLETDTIGFYEIENVLFELPSAQPEHLMDDDFETIRIHINAYKEGLCNQHRWEEAKEYQRIIDRFMTFASAQSEQQHERKFQNIVVEYPSYSPYPECKGKPYFSIKYMENGQEFIGYGTYKPEVLSEYLKEYFIPSAQPERKKGKWIRNDNGTYSCNVCHTWIPEEQHHYARYCLYCGTDMREKKNEQIH